METVINNPSGDRGGEGSGVGMIVGILIAIIIIVLFFVYGLPAIRGGQANDDVNIDVDLPNLPDGDGAGATGPGTGSDTGGGLY